MDLVRFHAEVLDILSSYLQRSQPEAFEMLFQYLFRAEIVEIEKAKARKSIIGTADSLHLSWEEVRELLDFAVTQFEVNQTKPFERASGEVILPGGHSFFNELPVALASLFLMNQEALERRESVPVPLRVIAADQSRFLHSLRGQLLNRNLPEIYRSRISSAWSKRHEFLRLTQETVSLEATASRLAQETEAGAALMLEDEALGRVLGTHVILVQDFSEVSLKDQAFLPLIPLALARAAALLRKVPPDQLELARRQLFEEMLAPLGFEWEGGSLRVNLSRLIHTLHQARERLTSSA